MYGLLEQNQWMGLQFQQFNNNPKQLAGISLSPNQAMKEFPLIKRQFAFSLPAAPYDKIEAK